MTVFIRCKRDGHIIRQPFIGHVEWGDGEFTLVKDPRVSLTVGTYCYMTETHEITEISADMIETPSAVRARSPKAQAEIYIENVFRR
jgi:hypothetical protein